MRKMRKGEKGFTLVELMIVIAIIGILAAIAIPQFSAYRERGFVASMQADAGSIRTAEEAYFADNSTYIATSNPIADLANFGCKALSTGNSITVAAGAGGINKDYLITVTSTSTSKTVTYTSATGVTATN